MTQKRIQLRIDSILGGFSPTFRLSGEDQYLDGIGIDTEVLGMSGQIVGKSFGGVFPTSASAVLSTSTLGEAPMWVSGSANTAGVFVYGSAGSIYTLTGVLALSGDGSQWKIADESGNTGGPGSGMMSYNGYMYFASPTTIFRLGALNATAPTMAEYWVTSLGASALTRSTYPTENNINYPSHVMHFHNDGKIYVADYNSTATDAPHGGIIHWFKTATDGTGGSLGYAALVLPPGFMPTAIESYGTDLAILCTPETVADSVIRTGTSALFLWDTISPTYYKHVTISETLATAMKNKNGELFILAGNLGVDSKLMKYLGGDSFQTLAVINKSSPPPASAMEILGNMICWGGYITGPESAAGLFTYGYRSGQLKPGAIHMPMRIKDSSNTLPTVSVVKSITRDPYPLLGWRTDTSAAYGLDQVTGEGTQAARWRTKVFNIGRPFRIRRIRVPLTEQVSATTSIIPTVYVDDGVSSVSLRTINSTNFQNSESIADFDSITISGQSNFYIDFAFTSTGPMGFSFPITIDVETDER